MNLIKNALKYDYHVNNYYNIYNVKSVINMRNFYEGNYYINGYLTSVFDLPSTNILKCTSKTNKKYKFRIQLQNEYNDFYHKKCNLHQEWKYKGNYHRLGDLPAYYVRGLNNIEEFVMDIKYYRYGKLHRENNLPSSLQIGMTKNNINKYMLKTYFVNGEYFRTNGPSFMYYENSYDIINELRSSDFVSKFFKYDENLVYILDDNDNYEDKLIIAYIKNEEFIRHDKPAFIYESNLNDNSTLMLEFDNGLLHGIQNPAVILKYGKKNFVQYYNHGELVYEEEENCNLSKYCSKVKYNPEQYALDIINKADTNIIYTLNF